jgi:hypothetical protein
MRNAVMAIWFGFCAACSNQATTGAGPTPSAVTKPPPGTAADRSGLTAPPTPTSAPAPTASGSTPTSTTSGILVFNQFDPPVPIQVNR